MVNHGGELLAVKRRRYVVPVGRILYQGSYALATVTHFFTKS